MAHEIPESSGPPIPSPPLSASHARFLAEEYLALWTEAGIESLAVSSARLVEKLAGGPDSGARLGREPARAAVRSSPGLAAIREELGDCRRCGLCDSRRQIVFGAGDPSARLAFVGEAPGEEEDAQGIPFLGEAGKLLTKIIEAMGFTREQVYIASVVKCRPPVGRSPTANEIKTCLPFLRAQLESVSPRVVVALGSSAAAALLGGEGVIPQLRGRFHPLGWISSIEVMPTFHPAHLLTTPAAKKMVWEDMKLVKARLEASA